MKDTPAKSRGPLFFHNLYLRPLGFWKHVCLPQIPSLSSLRLTLLSKTRNLKAFQQLEMFS